MANGFASGGATAPYPSNAYPGVAFFGAGVPGRSGFAVGKGSGGPSGGGGGRAGSAVNGIIPASVTTNHAIIMGLFVIGAYALWHFSSRL